MDLREIIWFYGFYLGGGILILAALIHMLYRRRSPASISVWLLLSVLAPYIFVVLYFLFGSRKRKNITSQKHLNPGFVPSKADASGIETLLGANGIAGASTDNDLRLYTQSSQAYEAFMQALQNARTSIYISTYVLKYDIMTKKLFDLLQQKAQAGVEVIILTDTVGSLGLYFRQYLLKKLRQSGVAVHFFMPLLKFRAYSRFNLRYHRKIYIIDNEVLFSGGMNLADEYMGPQENKNRWIDLMYEARGEAVRRYYEIFASDLAYTAAQMLPPPPQWRSKGSGQKLQVVPSGPDVQGDVLLEVLLDSIYNARQSIRIVTPYFIPDEAILQALHVASRKGVFVQILTAKRSNHFFADIIRSSFIRQLREWGISTLFFSHPMLHAKAAVFDDKAVMIGSLNFDYRSLLLNYEVVTISYDKSHIRQMQMWIAKLGAQSENKIKSAGRLRRLFENFMRIFAAQV